MRKPLWRRMLRWTGRFLLGLLVFLLLYTGAVLLLPLLGCNRDDAGSLDGTTIYVHSNGVHTDIVLPIRTDVKDWSRTFSFSNTASGDSSATHIAIGWGDKGFYLETKEWADLKASTAFKAVFGLSGSAFHVTYVDEPTVDEHCKSVRISDSTMAVLVACIEEGFVKSSDGSPIWIADRYYGTSDAFYEGTGRYGLFFTCNTWTNSVLKKSGLPAASWTALSGGIMRQYDH